MTKVSIRTSKIFKCQRSQLAEETEEEDEDADAETEEAKEGVEDQVVKGVKNTLDTRVPDMQTCP